MRTHAIKWLLSISLLFSGLTGFAGELTIDPGKLKNAKVQYVDHDKIRSFPVPVFAVRRPGLASGSDEIAEIKAKIVYPLIIESLNPIAAIVVEFFSNRQQDIGVAIYWSNGTAHESELSSLRSQLECWNAGIME